MYLPHNEEQITFIGDIPSQEDQFTFEAISDSLKTFSNSVKEVENISLKNRVLLVWLDYYRLKKYLMLAWDSIRVYKII